MASISSAYNPSDVGVKGSLFGLPFNSENGKIAILPVPWEVTASSTGGSSLAPSAILDQSTQIDLECLGIENAWHCAPFMLPIDGEWLAKNNALQVKSRAYINWLEAGQIAHEAPQHNKTLEEVNHASHQLNEWVKNKILDQLGNNKKVGLIGGEHSCCYGLIHALTEKYNTFGILQIDAHADLHQSYEGFEFSHASIMYNVLQWQTITSCVQVGVRDFGKDEKEMIDRHPHRINTFFDEELKMKLFEGVTWNTLCQKIIDKLPENVYVSFDIDGLSIDNCLNTGTPVPGGLTYDMAMYLLTRLRNSNKNVIGFDLSEVVPSRYTKVNEMVASKVLYQLCLLL